MTSVATHCTESHFLLTPSNNEPESREKWLERYNTELCNENCVLRNCVKTKQLQQDTIKHQAEQEIAELKEKQAAEMATLKQEMEKLKDEAARTRVCNIRLMREAETLREQLGYD